MRSLMQKKYSGSMQGWNYNVERLLGKLRIGRNKDTRYPTYSNNCANFVSQCLEAGGMKQTEGWYINSKQKDYRFFSYHTYERSDSWSEAKAQFEYFSNTNNGFSSEPAIEIAQDSSLKKIMAENTIQKGDLLYFKRSNGEIYHASIISKVDANEIYYSGNSKRRYDEPLSTNNEYGVVIVHLNGSIPE